MWRSIEKTKNILKKGARWSIGANSNVNLWSDWWCSEKPLEETVPCSLIPPNVGSELIKVNTLLNDEGDWDANTINQSFPTSVAEVIFKEKTPLFTIQSRISHTGKDLWMVTSQHLVPTNCIWCMMTKVKSGSGSGNV